VDRSFSIPVGGGDQLLKWLSFVASHLYGEAEGLPGQHHQPSFICMSDKLEVLDPYSRIDAAAGERGSNKVKRLRRGPRDRRGVCLEEGRD